MTNILTNATNTDAVLNMLSNSIPFTNHLEVSTGETLKMFIPFVTTMLGALAAFSLGWLRLKMDKREKEHSSLVGCQYALLSQWRVLNDIKHGVLDRYREDPNRHLNMPFFFRTQRHQSIRFEELTFILNSDEPNLLHDIYLADESCLAILKIFDERNAQQLLIRKDMESASSENKIKGKRVPIPAANIFILKSMTDAFYAITDTEVDKFDELIKRIHKFIKRNYRRKGLKADVHYDHSMQYYEK